MNREEFIKYIKELNINLNEDQLKQLDMFYQLLIEWNEKINLTTITDVEDVYLKHFYDSLTLIKEIDLTKNLNLCDVGSGAGFPGIVLKICFPNLKITLVDSLNKRVIYLNEIIKQLGLKDIIAKHYRMEEFAKEHIEEFDIITARAVANMNVLMEISVKALKINGFMIFMKANCEEELNNCNNALLKLNCEIKNINRFSLPKNQGIRTLVKIEKINKTNDLYPRTIDKIKKKPL